MLALRQYSLAGSLLLLSLLACDQDQPLAPDESLAVVPKPATGLGATAVSPSQIELAWQDGSPNETGFEVHRSTTGPNGAFALLATTGSNVVNYSDAGLSAATQYCYKVRAFKRSGPNTGYSAFSNTACATTLGPPAAPSNTNATPPSSIRVDVTWTDNSLTENGFRLERSAGEAGPWASVAQLGANVTSYSDGNRAAEEQVCYRVIAFNGNGDSGPSNVDCTAPPAGPTSLAAASVDAQSIDLTWVDNSAVEDGYEVRRAGVDFQFSVIASLPANTSGYHDGSVNPDTRYWYSVRALKDGGGSHFSNYDDAIAISAPPNAPSDARATPGSSSTVWVFWVNASANTDGFRVERSTDGGTSWATAGTTDLYQQSLFDEGRSAEQPVCYRVFAFNSKGESGPSNNACTAPPAAPTFLVATTAQGLVAIDLTWSDNSSVEDGYEVQRLFEDCSYYYGCYSYYAGIATVNPNVTSYRDAGVGAGEFHSYLVVAIKDGGYSDPSNGAGAWSSLPPAAPSNLSATAVSSGQIDLAWTDNASDEDFFDIHRCLGDALACDDAGFFWIASTNANATSFSDVGLQAGTTYTYRVLAIRIPLGSQPSNEATATTPP